MDNFHTAFIRRFSVFILDIIQTCCSFHGSGPLTHKFMNLFGETHWSRHHPNIKPLPTQGRTTQKNSNIYISSRIRTYDSSIRTTQHILASALTANETGFYLIRRMYTNRNKDMKRHYLITSEWNKIICNMNLLRTHMLTSSICNTTSFLFPPHNL